MKPRRFCSSRNGFNRLPVLLCSVAVLLGGMIYFLFRASEPLFMKWIPGIGADSWFSFVRLRSVSYGRSLPEWIVFSLPNGLWAFAFALLITSIWAGSHSWLRIIWMASIPVIVVGSEILRAPGPYPAYFACRTWHLVLQDY